MVLKLTKDGRVQVVLGRPIHCHPSHYAADSIQSSPLNEPQSIAFSPQGDLYVAESDGQRINRVRRAAPNGRRLEVSRPGSGSFNFCVRVLLSNSNSNLYFLQTNSAHNIELTVILYYIRNIDHSMKILTVYFFVK